MIKKTINFVIPGTVYPFDVMVSICESNEALSRQLTRHGVKYEGVDLNHAPTAKGRCIMFEGGQTLIRLYDYPQTAKEFGHLQHEIFHAVEFIMNRIEIKLCYKSDEAFAYLIGYYTQEIYKKLKFK